jgi:hypothetical protein
MKTTEAPSANPYPYGENVSAAMEQTKQHFFGLTIPVLTRSYCTETRFWTTSLWHLAVSMRPNSPPNSRLPITSIYTLPHPHRPPSRRLVPSYPSPPLMPSHPSLYLSPPAVILNTKFTTTAASNATANTLGPNRSSNPPWPLSRMLFALQWNVISA